MDRAWVHEIFASLQGEGPRIGERHIFVRFYGCDVGCRYCDTPAALINPREGGAPSVCAVRTYPPDGVVRTVANPVSGGELSVLCDQLVVRGPSRPVLSLTGGEPLLQAGFLLSWLPRVKKSYCIYLETSGIHDAALRSLNGLLDIVSMDFKLPSSTGLRPYWDEHERFLAAVGKAEVFVKAVVTPDTLLGDIITAARILAEQGRVIPLILQPSPEMVASGTGKLLRFQEAALGMLRNVQIIPQIHKILSVP